MFSFPFCMHIAVHFPECYRELQYRRECSGYPLYNHSTLTLSYHSIPWVSGDTANNSSSTLLQKLPLSYLNKLSSLLAFLFFCAILFIVISGLMLTQIKSIFPFYHTTLILHYWGSFKESPSTIEKQLNYRWPCVHFSSFVPHPFVLIRNWSQSVWKHGSNLIIQTLFHIFHWFTWTQCRQLMVSVYLNWNLSAVFITHLL